MIFLLDVYVRPGARRGPVLHLSVQRSRVDVCVCKSIPFSLKINSDKMSGLMTERPLFMERESISNDSIIIRKIFSLLKDLQKKDKRKTMLFFRSSHSILNPTRKVTI
jgi:hypothetical protein